MVGAQRPLCRTGRRARGSRARGIERSGGKLQREVTARGGRNEWAGARAAGAIAEAEGQRCVRNRRCPVGQAARAAVPRRLRLPCLMPGCEAAADRARRPAVGRRGDCASPARYGRAPGRQQDRHPRDLLGVRARFGPAVHDRGLPAAAAPARAADCPRQAQRPRGREDGGGQAQASYTEEDLELAQSVRGLIGRRLERLSEPAQRMLVAAAVIGRDFDISLLEAFGELSGHELRDALDEAKRGHFLASAGLDRYRFGHDLVRQRVLAVLPLPRLQAYHLAVADTLERVYGKTANDHAAEIGFHLYQAGTAADPLRTAEHLAHAAANALAVGAFEEVLRLVDSELQLMPADRARERAEALATRAHALWGLGRIEDAKAAWKGAIQRYEELGDAKAAGALHRRLAHLEARGDSRDANGAGPVELPAPAELEVTN